jgi:protein-S-isoprenylcysteine O-methyltransferase Ste14
LLTAKGLSTSSQAKKPAPKPFRLNGGRREIDQTPPTKPLLEVSNWFSHDAGHLPEMMFGWKANPHFGPFHVLSFIFIGGGFVLISVGWTALYEAQRQGRLATSGIYARIRHPQYDGFVLVMFGFLLQWPTLLTLAMFPVLVIMYWRLAKAEERDAIAQFGDTYREYMRKVPAFFPHLRASIGNANGNAAGR